MNWGILLGLLVALVGVSIVLNAVFHVSVPLVRTAIALFLVFLGVRVLVRAWTPGQRFEETSGSAFLSESTTFTPKQLPNGDLQYDVVFAQGVVDLRALPAPERDVTVTVNAIFASATVLVDPAVPYDVEGSAVFGGAKVPNRSMAAFGSTRYESGTARPLLHVKINAVFGACELRERPGAVHSTPGDHPVPMGVPLG